MQALTACLSLLLTALLPAPSAVAAVPAGFAETVLATDLRLGTGMEFAPDGRLFVLSQDGVVRIVSDGRLLPTPFLRLPGVDARGERGLLGLTFDPAFAVNGYVYLYYTVGGTSPHNRVSRVVASGDVALTSGGALVETVLMELEPLRSDSFIHNGGALAFGPDGMLHIAVGDNAAGARAQTLDNRFGKILRIARNGTVPLDNPFVGRGAEGANRAIWALGLRNPFALTFSRAGVLHINDVGQNAWEEVDVGRAGANYGWPTTEGPTTDSRFTSPLYAYAHSGTGVTGCAITGGAFYEPPVPGYPSDHVGDYFFADYCSNWIKRRDASGTVSDVVTSSAANPIAVEVGPDGDVHYLTRRPDSGSTLVRVDFTGGSAATITGQPSSTTVSVGEPAVFSVTAVGAAPLSYQWQRNGVDLPGATAATYRLASATSADSGARFRVVVRNATSTATSAAATLTVTSDRRPSAVISTPAAGATYAGGTTITFAGSGSDPEDGTLPATALTWRIDFHHADHTHPFLPPVSGVSSGSAAVPVSGHVDSNVWYRIHLQVRDSAGLVGESFRDVVPRTAGLTVTTVPAGLRVDVDGQPRTAPYTESAVVGLRRSLAAPLVQQAGGVEYEFAGWSDGGAASHDITTAATATTYTATYRARGRILTLTPAADTTARQQAPTTAGGALSSLAADTQSVTGDPATRVTSYVRFSVPALAAGESIASAALSLQVTNATGDGPELWRTADSWSESALTWAAGQPARTGTAAVGDFGSMATGRVSTSVTGVTGAGQVSLQLFADSGDGVTVASREAVAESRPQLRLLVRTASGPSAPTSVTAVRSDAARTATLRWAPPTTDGGTAITGYRVSRDGFDTAAVGPWSTTVAATARELTFTGLAPGSTYLLAVQAVTAGTTGPAGTALVTMAGRTLTLVATADTMAREQVPTTAYGSATTLLADGQEVSGVPSRVSSYLRFPVPALAAGESVAASRLVLRVTNPTTDGPVLWRTATSWSESALTWSSGQPVRTGTAAVGDFPALANGRATTQVAGVTGAGEVSLQLHAPTGDGVAFSSREVPAAADRPTLVVSVAPPP